METLRARVPISRGRRQKHREDPIPNHLGEKAIFIAIDVGYYDEDKATAVAVVFESLDSPDFKFHLKIGSVGIAPYEPGKFYLRELPSIRELLAVILAEPGADTGCAPLDNLRIPIDDVECIFIDGYVDLGAAPGLGRYVYNLSEVNAIPVIGIAKTKFKFGWAAEVLRGKSKKPLYVTAAGMSQEDAAAIVSKLHGPYRMPTLIKETDRLTRIPFANI